MTTSTGLGIAGAIIGGILVPGIGASIGFLAGSMLGNLLDPTITKGPELNDKKLQNSQYGMPLAYVWGQVRMAGSVDWIANNGELVSHKNRSSGKGGPQVETTTYTAGWSVKYCVTTRRGQPALKSIDKHWADGRVVEEDDINPTVYIGGPEQLPDLSMEADLGVGEVSADRGIGKEVYNEVQMGQFYNRIPNMEVLVNTTAPINGHIEQLTIKHLDVGTNFPNYPKIVGDWPIDVDNPDSLAPPPSVVGDPFIYSEGFQANRTARGGLYKYANGDTVELWQNHCTYHCPIGGMDPSVGPWPFSYDMPQFIAKNTTPVDATYGNDFAYMAGVEVGRFVYGWCTTMDGTVAIIQTSNLQPGYPGVHDLKWHKIIDGQMVAEGGIQPAGSTVHGQDISLGCGNEGDNISGLIKSIIEPNEQYIWSLHTAQFFYDGFDHLEKVIALYYIDDTDNVLKSYNAGSISASLGGPAHNGSTSGAIVCPEEGYCATISAYNEYALYTRLEEASPVTLAQILADIFELRDGLTSAQYDVSAAESTIVHGLLFSSQMQKRNMIDMLRQTYFFDIVESDNGTNAFLKVVMRGGASVVTIPDEDLGVVLEGSDPVALIELVNHIQDAELPAKITVTYYDVDQDFQVGTQEAQRNAYNVDNVTQLNLPVAMDGGKARAIAQRHLYSAYLERDTYAFSTSRKYAYLEPTDVVTVRGIQLRLLEKIETPQGVISWKGVPSAAYIAQYDEDLGVPAEGSNPNPPGASTKVASQLMLLNIPLINDLDVGNDGDYQIRAAMAPSDPDGKWSGSSLYISRDSGVTYTEAVSTEVPCRMGATTNDLLEDWDDGYQMDWVSRVAVETIGELESVTEEALLNGANLCLIGDEMIQFMSAELLETGEYELSGLLRGRRGTEQAAFGHLAGERFVMLEDTVEVPLTSADLNLPRMYKAVAYGYTIAETTAVTFTNTGVALRPYAPTEVTGGYNPSGDVFIQFKRRTRRGGELNDFTDVPIGETVEKYGLEIWDSSYQFCAFAGYVTPSFDEDDIRQLTYLASAQVAHFGALQSWVYGKVAQIGLNGAGMFTKFRVRGMGTTEDEPLVAVDPLFNGPSFPPPPTPGAPPTGNFPIDDTLSSGHNNVNTPGFVIGNTYRFKLTTRGSGAITAASIGMGEYQDPPYFRTAVLSTDAAGTNIVKAAGGLTPYMYLGSLANGTDYYLTIRTEFSAGNPSGPIGNSCRMIVYANGVF